MKHLEGHFKDSRSLSIYYQGWLPEKEVTAVLLIVHGIGEHSGRYMNVVNHFVPRGYAVYALDHMGHGQSEGTRAFVERFEDFTETLALFHHQVNDWQKDKPLFLLGHSLGGTIISYYLLDHPKGQNGVILSAPAVKVGNSISRVSIAMSKLLSRVTPALGVLKLDIQGISRDPTVVEQYIQDPLVYHGKIGARLASEILHAMTRITAEVETISTPFMVLQGSEDMLVDPDGARMLYKEAGSTDKTIQVYDNLFHEIFNEPEHEQVLNDVEHWVAAHL